MTRSITYAETEIANCVLIKLNKCFSLTSKFFKSKLSSFACECVRIH